MNNSDYLLADEDKFHVLCKTCGTMQYATQTFASALAVSRHSGDMVLFDCGHSIGYTYEQLSKLSPVYDIVLQHGGY